MRSGWSILDGALGERVEHLEQRRARRTRASPCRASPGSRPRSAATGMNCRGLHRADALEERAVLLLDPLEMPLVVADQVHLVDADDHLPDAEHRQDVAVAAAVLAHALLGVDDQHGRLGARRARDHVLQELDVPGRVDDDVVARLALEEAARGVDGDALVLLVVERVEQERVLERLAGALALAPHRVELALRQRAGVGQQPPDDGALAVIDVADDDDVHRVALGFGQGAHMYPLRRSSSRPCLPSCRRPERSAMLRSLPLLSSTMMSSTFFDVLLIGAWHGPQPRLR